MKYCKKPVTIEAFKYSYNYPNEKYYPDWFHKACDKKTVWMHTDGNIRITTLEGDHIVSEGDYVIQGIKGELYPCKPDIFEQTYEKI